MDPTPNSQQFQTPGLFSLKEWKEPYFSFTHSGLGSVFQSFQITIQKETTEEKRGIHPSYEVKALADELEFVAQYLVSQPLGWINLLQHIQYVNESQ